MWDDDIVLHLLTYLWNVSIIILNAKKMEEYYIRHTLSLKDVNIILIFNGYNHYSGLVEPKINL